MFDHIEGTHQIDEQTSASDTMGNGTADISDFATYSAAVWLWRIISPVFILFGTFGNIMTIAILTRHRHQLSSTSVYLSALAISDILALNTGLLRQWVTYTFDVDVRVDFSEAGCKVHWFVVYVVTQLSSWLLVCVTAERLLSSWLPHRRRAACNTKSALIVVAGILGFLVLLNFHYLVGYGDLTTHAGNTTTTTKCVPLTEAYDNFIKYRWTWIDLCVFFLIPLCILISGNSAVVYKVITSKRKSRRVAPGPASNHVSTVSAEPPRQQGAFKTSSLTITLLIVSIVFIVCITPIVVFPIGQPFWEASASHDKLAELFLCETVANLFMYANHAINFVLYFLSGSKFREETKKILCQKGNSNNGSALPDSRSASIFPRT